MNHKLIPILITILIFLIIKPLYPQEDSSPEASPPGLISLDFQDTDIRQALKVLGDITQKVIIPHPDLQGKITVVSLKGVKPEVVENVLESALNVRGFTLVSSGNVLKVVPLPETKQTNVEVEVGLSPEKIEEEDKVITQVIPLKYASGAELKTMLSSLVGKHGNILADQRTNTLIITDTASNIKRLSLIIKELEKPLPTKMQVKTFVLNYGSAEKVAEILNELSEDKEIPSPLFSVELPEEKEPLQITGKIKAFPEEETNSIIVASASTNFSAIEKIIKKLDVLPPQVMIEVIIMDVTLSDEFIMGVEFAHPTSSTSTTEGVKVDLGGNTDKESIFHSLLNLGEDALEKGFTYRLLNRKETLNLLAFILDSQENSKVLSTPRILASNNQESTITVGQEVPIIESSVVDLVNNVKTVNYKYEDVGLQLKVTPRVSKDKIVNLIVHAELKDLSPQKIYDASIINKREADATVIVPDGYTVVLGGLMRDNNSVIENKIPLLGDIPILGNLFKKTKTTLLKTELLIFLTPKIVEGEKDIKKITSLSEDKLKKIEKAQNKREIKKAVREVVGYLQKK
ncbi:MAG: hypothetical protein DRP61_02035 [Candidatus Omnitrophota bacterium]|nr:MAG: hypothetical protein DRP61_02035 [Candidatus Omnitrophota bacterium]RKY33620.1 MAG: hypothetical protein DRP69_06125 [Candidatus Omnitrophota bacterium]RKY42478.1 MAG: hypothetical protein DRP80_06765 [Candidatus Omnitrophota bacterium]